MRHNSRTGTHTIEYDDGEKETLKMDHESNHVLEQTASNDDSFRDASETHITTKSNNVEIRPKI